MAITIHRTGLLGWNTGLDYWAEILDWTTGLNYLDRFLYLFLEGSSQFLKSTSSRLLWMIVIMTSCLLQCYVIIVKFMEKGSKGSRQKAIKA